VKTIIGLGNPGKEYDRTRHNVGFRVVDALANELGLKFSFDKKINADVAKNDGVVLLKPQTFMNESGESVAAFLEYYKIAPKNLWMIHDEVDLPFGTLRERNAGSGSAGHKGVGSLLSIEKIAGELGGLRIGIENRADRAVPPTDVYVLQNFSAEEERELTDKIIPQAVSEIKAKIK